MGESNPNIAPVTVCFFLLRLWAGRKAKLNSLTLSLNPGLIRDSLYFSATISVVNYVSLFLEPVCIMQINSLQFLKGRLFSAICWPMRLVFDLIPEL